MRRLALPTLLATVALVLSGCTPGTSSTTPDESAAALPGMPTIEGGFGEQPVVTWPGGEPLDGLQVEWLHSGDGETVGTGDFIVANYIGQVWNAETAFNDSWEMGYPIGFSLNQVIQGWSEGIPGSRVGDRLLLVIPSDMGYPDGNEGAGIAAGDTLIFVIDVLGTYPEGDLYGEADATDTGALAGLPVTVEGAIGSEPTIAVTDGAAEPTELEAFVIAEGSGETVGDEGVLVVAYHVVSWGGEEAGSTWSAGIPETVPLQGGTVFDSLIGAPVGSRIVLLVPPNGDTPAMAAVVELLGYHPLNAS